MRMKIQIIIVTIISEEYYDSKATGLRNDATGQENEEEEEIHRMGCTGTNERTNSRHSIS